MAESQTLQRYGVPFYGAAWVPYNHVISKLTSKEAKEDRDESKDEATASKSEEIDNTAAHNYVALAGGGGEGHSGIPNAILLAHFNFSSNALSDQTVARLDNGSDLPYRMAVHPGGDGIICAFQNSCRLFEWFENNEADVHKLDIKASEKVLSQLEDVGQQLALAFDADGSKLAAGSEDGNLRVFKWPSMDTILHEAQAHASVKDLTFSPDGKFLVSLGNRGPGRVWDLASAAIKASISKENGEIFSFCRFSPISDEQPVLYIAANTDKGGSIVTWNTDSWRRTRAKQVVRDAVSSFNISADGNLLAIGTAQGDITIVNSRNMQVHTVVRKAHLGIVTSLAFSHDTRALVSASMDSSARVTLIQEKKTSGGSNLWITLLIILVAIIAYFMNSKESFLS